MRVQVSYIYTYMFSSCRIYLFVDLFIHWIWWFVCLELFGWCFYAEPFDPTRGWLLAIDAPLYECFLFKTAARHIPSWLIHCCYYYYYYYYYYSYSTPDSSSEDAPTTICFLTFAVTNFSLPMKLLRAKRGGATLWKDMISNWSNPNICHPNNRGSSLTLHYSTFLREILRVTSLQFW